MGARELGELGLKDGELGSEFVDVRFLEILTMGGELEGCLGVAS